MSKVDQVRRVIAGPHTPSSNALELTPFEVAMATNPFVRLGVRMSDVAETASSPEVKRRIMAGALAGAAATNLALRPAPAMASPAPAQLKLLAADVELAMRASRATLPGYTALTVGSPVVGDVSGVPAQRSFTFSVISDGDRLAFDLDGAAEIGGRSIFDLVGAQLELRRLDPEAPATFVVGRPDASDLTRFETPPLPRGTYALDITLGEHTPEIIRRIAAERAYFVEEQVAEAKDGYHPREDAPYEAKIAALDRIITRATLDAEARYAAEHPSEVRALREYEAEKRALEQLGGAFTLASELIGNDPAANWLDTFAVIRCDDASCGASGAVHDAIYDREVPEMKLTAVVKLLRPAVEDVEITVRRPSVPLDPKTNEPELPWEVGKIVVKKGMMVGKLDFLAGRASTPDYYSNVFAGVYPEGINGTSGQTWKTTGAGVGQIPEDRRAVKAGKVYPNGQAVGAYVEPREARRSWIHARTGELEIGRDMHSDFVEALLGMPERELHALGIEVPVTADEYQTLRADGDRDLPIFRAPAIPRER